MKSITANIPAHTHIANTICDILEEVAKERVKQIDHGYSAEHDDEWAAGELADGAAAYAAYAAGQAMTGIELDALSTDALRLWPFEQEFFKPVEQRKNLIRATAMLVAEIERIDRLSAANS